MHFVPQMRLQNFRMRGGQMKTRECDVGGAVRLPKQFYERPLTLEESRFASEHISIVYRYLRQQGLNSDE